MLMCVSVCVCRPVDVWAVGCLLIEMLTGQPLFPGDSDLDQIYHIVRCFGRHTYKHLSDQNMQNLLFWNSTQLYSFEFSLFSMLGNLTAHHQELFYRNPVFSGVRLPECSGRVPLEERFPSVNTTTLDLAQVLFSLCTDLNVTIQKSWKDLRIHI